MTDVLLLPSPADHWETSRRETGRSVSFIQPAPLIDVLFDQLEYLVSHTGQECPPGCPDCARLNEVKKLLLIPFGSPNAPETPRPVAA
jgi:hypothetical protein